MARSSMAALITRIRVLINDPAGASQVFTDDQIQDVSDESRVDMVNALLKPTVTYAPTVQYLNYYSDLGGWETDYVILQNLSAAVTPSTSEPIAGKFTFSSSTPPTLTITGKLHDVYHASADLLERWAAKKALDFDVVVGGQTFRQAQVADALQKLAMAYRRQQRASSITMKRSDLTGRSARNLLEPRSIDYMANGD
jgi:hypothetical protein